MDDVRRRAAADANFHRSARGLGLLDTQAAGHQGDGRRREVAVGRERGNLALRESDLELVFQLYGEIEQIERVGGEVVRERGFGVERLDVDAERIGDDRSQARLDAVVQGSEAARRARGSAVAEHAEIRGDQLTSRLRGLRPRPI
jgi:hypothetical protein